MSNLSDEDDPHFEINHETLPSNTGCLMLNLKKKMNIQICRGNNRKEQNASLTENNSPDDAEQGPNCSKQRTFCWRIHEPPQHAVTLE